MTSKIFPRPALLRLTIAIAFSAVAFLGLAPVSEAAGSFQRWLDGVRAEAGRKGVSKEILDKSLAGITLDPRVIEKDRKQPEFDWTFERYQKLVVSPEQIANGRRNFRLNKGLLDDASEITGVPSQIIAALWGVESRYSKRQGDYSVIRSLATLAHDGRRSKYFRRELIAALRILEEGHIAPEKMLGSWAGAMGQIQFMPTSFRAYARDGDGDGRRDIWGTSEDVFLSAGTYLKRAGWVKSQTWGRPVTLPKKFSRRLIGRKVKKSVAAWRKLGVEIPAGAGGKKIEGKTKGRIVQPDGAGTQAYIAFRNFEVIRRWNPSDYFALAAGLLSEEILKQD